MTAEGFGSVLFERAGEGAGEAVGAAAFKDLNLDQLVAAVTAGRDDYDLAPLFAAPARSVETIAYRHEIARDLEGKAVADGVRLFARRMVSVRTHLAQAGKLHHVLQQERWFLSAAENYCAAVTGLVAALATAQPRSRGLRALLDYVTAYAGTAMFQDLVAETTDITARLAGVHYRLHIKGNTVNVSRYDGEADYSEEIEQTFARFQQDAVKDYRIVFESPPELNHVEAGILERVAKLHPEVFTELQRFRGRYQDFVDPTIARFDREVQFYLAYLEYLEPLKAAGLGFCYPVVGKAKSIHATATFDLALAAALVADGTAVVRNDFHLTGSERVLVVTGPNQGGKTTFARTFGQLHHLAALGLPVPGDDARLFLFDRLFTHFGREEYLADLRGKLQDDLVRIRDILAAATGDSIVIMNEIFNSTTLRDAVVLGRRVLTDIVDRDLLCVFVTFLDELATEDETVVSLVSTVDPADPTTRTYRVVRQPANGLAHAAAIAAKYGLTYAQLKGRLGR
ncbi:MutS-related protein [Kribbella swartbergensis]